VKIDVVKKSIIHLIYPDREALCSSFVRFQEHYESPKFKGEIFTLGEFRSWYAQEYGSYTYPRDWDGFNFPCYVLKPFIKGLFDPLTEAEAEIVELFKDRTDDFYIIGSHENSGKDVVLHESFHAVYSLNKEYRDDVNLYLSKCNIDDVMGLLLEHGYHDDVLLDECNAYIGASSEYLISKGFEVGEEIVADLNNMFNQAMVRLDGPSFGH